ncbi:MAG: response regulator [Planctomycetota bacterium]|jgi:DNA-binding response OmpR family regulator
MYKILVVDDNEEVCYFLSTIIRKENCAPLVFKNADDVLSDSTSTEDIDIAILDINMPGDSGVKLAWKLRKKLPDLPIVILSGNLSQWYIPDIRDCGADCIIEKPADVKMLQNTIHRFTVMGRKGSCLNCPYCGNGCTYYIEDTQAAG